MDGRKLREGCIVQVLQGDCLELMPELASESVDMILCDLPYGTTQNKWDSIIPLEPLWEQYERIIKPNGAIVLTAQSPFDKVLACSNLSLFRYEWIWEKTNATGHLNAKRMPMKAHENVLVFYKSLPTYNPQKTTGHERKVSTAEHRRGSKLSSNYGEYVPNGYDSTERFPRSVQVFPMDKQKSKLHPTQKPVALMEYLIKTYTNPGDLVLDNACGSGSTGVAALNLGRRFLGMELDKEYANIARNRVDVA
jgi:site-specific DNA-methyltransferase (adenine-specific)